MKRCTMPRPGRVKREKYERTLSPVISEDDDASEVSVCESVENDDRSLRARVRDVVAYTRRRACERVRENVRNVVEFVGAMLLLTWMVLRYYRLHASPSV